MQFRRSPSMFARQLRCSPTLFGPVAVRKRLFAVLAETGMRHGCGIVVAASSFSYRRRERRHSLRSLIAAPRQPRMTRLLTALTCLTTDQVRRRHRSRSQRIGDRMSPRIALAFAATIALAVVVAGSAFATTIVAVRWALTDTAPPTEPLRATGAWLVPFLLMQAWSNYLRNASTREDM